MNRGLPWAISLHGYLDLRIPLFGVFLVTMVNSLLMPRSEMISYHAAEFVKGEIPGSEDVLAPEVRASLSVGDPGSKPAGEVGAGALSLEVVLLQVDQVVPATIH
jgi:hypothetical protein